MKMFAKLVILLGGLIVLVAIYPAETTMGRIGDPSDESNLSLDSREPHYLPGRLPATKPLAGAPFANIAVFDDPAFVDTTGGPTSESDEVQAALTFLGHSVTTFTGITAADFSAALAGQDILLIPELEHGDLGAALSPAAITVISDFVANGGGLIILGHFSNAPNFLNQVFGFATAPAGSSGAGSSTRQSAANGTAFIGSPGSVAHNNVTLFLQTTSLPPGARPIYLSTGPFAGQTTVAWIPFSQGQIIFLGWDWFDAIPAPGAQDGGWIQGVLDSAVHQAANSQPCPGQMDGFGYTCRDSLDPGGPAFAFEDISATGAIALDGTLDSEANVTMPFNFSYYNVTSNILTLGNNGAIIFGLFNQQVDSTNQPLPSAPNYMIAPFWDNLDDDPGAPGMGGAIYTETRGTAPNRRFIIQWENIQHFDDVGTATFQLILFEDSNKILFQYQDGFFGDTNLDYGQSAAVGIRGNVAGNSLQYSADQAIVRDSLAILFTPAQFVTKTANPDPAVVGEELTYTIAVTNPTTAPLTGVILTDTVPMSTTYVPGSASNGGSEAGGVVQWNLNTIAPGANEIRTFKVTVDPFPLPYFFDDMEGGTAIGQPPVCGT